MGDEQIEKLTAKMFEAFDTCKKTTDALIESGVVCTHQYVDLNMEINSYTGQMDDDSAIIIVSEFGIPRYVYTPLGSIRIIQSIYRNVNMNIIQGEMIERANLVEVKDVKIPEYVSKTSHKIWIDLNHDDCIQFRKKEDYVSRDDVGHLFNQILRKYIYQ